MTTDTSARAVRAEHILDVAADLLDKFGYRKVTVDDIADAADVGKGTIYLHWKTREALFIAVLLREYLGSTDELIAGLRADPQAVLLHRTAQTQFRRITGTPLLRAVYTNNSETLGKLCDGLHKTLDPRHHSAFEEYLTMLGEHGLLRTDMTSSQVAQAFRAILRGFLYAEDGQEAILGDVIARSLEPAGPFADDVLAPIAERAALLFAEAADADRAVLRRAY